MLRSSLSSAVIIALASASGGCAQNPPVAATTPAVSETASAPPPAGSGMMGGGQGMMPGQGMMGAGMMDGGPAMMGASTMDGGQGMMAGHGMMGSGMMDMMGTGDPCPMLVPGTTVLAKDTTDGMTMSFATTGDVAELRRRVHGMADHMNAHASGGMAMRGMTMGSDAGMGMMGGSMTGGSMMGAMMPAVHAQVEEVDRGARLKTTPVDPTKLGEMRQHMKQHAQMMNQSRTCSMVADAGS